MTLQARTQALLDLIEADRAARRDAVLRQAQEQADEARVQARAQARQLLRQAFAAERERAQARLEAARAEFATALRLHRQRRLEALLAQGWQRLPQRLAERWQDAAARAAWVDAALLAARAALPPQGWRLTHPADWPQAERQACDTALRSHLHDAPAWVADPSLRAGLRIVAAGNVVDATPAGLLADRDEIGALLVGELGSAR